MPEVVLNTRLRDATTWSHSTDCEIRLGRPVIGHDIELVGYVIPKREQNVVEGRNVLKLIVAGTIYTITFQTGIYSVGTMVAEMKLLLNSLGKGVWTVSLTNASKMEIANDSYNFSILWDVAESTLSRTLCGWPVGFSTRVGSAFQKAVSPLSPDISVSSTYNLTIDGLNNRAIVGVANRSAWRPVSWSIEAGSDLFSYISPHEHRKYQVIRSAESYHDRFHMTLTDEDGDVIAMGSDFVVTLMVS